MRKEKKNYFQILDTGIVTDNKSFWKTIKPFFFDKVSRTNKIILAENNEIVSSDAAIAEKFNSFFASITETIRIAEVTVNITPCEILKI